MINNEKIFVTQKHYIMIARAITTLRSTLRKTFSLIGIKIVILPLYSFREKKKRIKENIERVV